MAGAVEQAQRKCAEAVADMLKRHQETLDEEYRAGIRAIDDAFRVGEAKDPAQFQRLSEELWRRNCEVLKTAVASQMHDVQSVMRSGMRPCAWARWERKSDPQKLRIDRNDERVCVRIVPRSHLYAGCFGWFVLRPKHPGYTTDPGAGMSGLQVDD